MGFEYGYSVARPEALTLWEAQFGDFVNGAQTIIDEFISSGEAKWQQQSGVVLLLPHGYEGQGPDHSSARIERFLTLAADDAFTVAQPSTPASYFHLLRQHSLGSDAPADDRLHPEVDAASARTRRLDARGLHVRHLPAGHRRRGRRDPSAVEHALLCSGRITWDLLAERKRARPNGITTAIARLEQLYPRPVDEVKAEIAKYPNLEEIRWVQDEPANMGPWPHMALNLAPELGARRRRFNRVSRPESAAPVGRPDVGAPAASCSDLLAGAFA